MRLAVQEHLTELTVESVQGHKTRIQQLPICCERGLGQRGNFWRSIPLGIQHVELGRTAVVAVSDAFVQALKVALAAAPFQLSDLTLGFSRLPRNIRVTRCQHR